MEESQQLRILSLDGGGIRGLSSLVILKEIMERVGANMDPPQSDLKPCDYFDLIGGTSTGGIIAIMLGRLRMSVEECRSEYIRLGKQVFSNPRILPNESMFDASKLEAAIKDTIRRKLGQGNVDAPFIDPLGRECCKTVVYTLPASSPAASQPTAFRSYTSRHAPRKEPYTIWQAGRATSAATTFFEPLQTGSPPDTRRWIDAGMGFNNPARVIFEETGSLYGDARGHLDHNKHISVFLTLGTGFKNVVRLDAETRKEKISAKFRVPLKAIEVMQDIVTGTENVHTSLRKAFERKSDIYHRFNVEQGLQDVELYDYQQTEAMEADTENYTTARNVEIMDCVLAMAKLPLKLKPLDERGNPEEVFGTTGAADYKSLKNRLDALRIQMDQFKHNEMRFESSDTYKHSIGANLADARYMWNAVVLADILDKQGRLIAEGLGQQEMLRPQGTGHSSERFEGYDESMCSAKRQIEAYARLHEAVKIYRHLFHATESHFSPSSLQHCWVANRLGGILEIFGLRQEALELYERARDGRMKELPSHKASLESTERVKFLRSSLSEQ